MIDLRHDYWSNRLAELEIATDLALTNITRAEAARLGQLSLFSTETQIIPFPRPQDTFVGEDRNVVYPEFGGEVAPIVA